MRIILKPQLFESLKKLPQIKPINQKLLETPKPEQVEVEIRLAEEDVEEEIEESELDEMYIYSMLNSQ